MMARPSGREMRSEIIAAATEMIQKKGVTGFSYGDLATQLEIKSPSIHHHFPTKAELVGKVVAEYADGFAANVAEIPAGSAPDRIQAYAQLFASVAASDQLCLCGSVSADWLAVGGSTQQEVERFFAQQRSWLEAEINAGAAAGDIRTDLGAADLAVAVIACLEGALLIDRAQAASGSLSEGVSQTVAALIRTNGKGGSR